MRRKINREVAHNFLLSEALTYKVAYHHADLPPRIRIELEHLISSNQIDVVISTTTLAEGVNLPISTVIFEDWITHVDARKKEKSSPLDISKFRNIAGRAGRAGKETEGVILFLEPNRENKRIILGNDKRLTPREYFIRDQYPPIQSRFLEIVSNYKVPSDDDLDRAWNDGDGNWKPEVRRALRQFGSAVLHALSVLRSSDDSIIEQFLDKSLLNVQSPEKKSVAKEWFATWVRFYRRVPLENEELRPIAMQVGLPLRAVQRLYANLVSQPERHRLFHKDSSEETLLSKAQVQTATTLIASVQELDWNPSNAPHADLLAQWINGASIEEISKIYGRYLETKGRPIEKTCNYTIQQLSNQGAWGMYALVRVLGLILGESEIAPIVKRLPLFAYFGVHTVPAARLSLMGIERIDAIRVGASYIDSGHSDQTGSAIRSWAQAIGTSAVSIILQGNDSREIDRDTLRILGI